MALSSFGRGRDDTSGSMPAATTPSSGGASGAPGGLSAFIDRGSEFEGKLSFRDTVRIDGRFRGEISSDNTLIVGESGEIEASIRSLAVAISGSVVGNITAGQRVILHKTARVEGDVETPSLTIEEGAVLNGQLTMKAPEGKASGAGPLKAVDGGSAPSAPPEPSSGS